MIRPVMAIPKRRIKAPTEVTSEESPSQASFPKIPALPMVETEIKKIRPPTMTLGWERGILILESMKAKDRKIKGRKIVAQEK